MIMDHTNDSSKTAPAVARRGRRACCIVLLRFVVPLVVPGAAMGSRSDRAHSPARIGDRSLWWLFFSRAPWSERLGAIVLMVVAVFATQPFVHESIAGADDGDDALRICVVPVSEPRPGRLGGGHAVASPTGRRASMVAAILLACAAWTLVRTDGVIGDAGSEFHWRWTPTSEERLLAQTRDEPTPLAASAGSPAPVPTRRSSRLQRTDSSSDRSPTRLRRRARAAVPAPARRERARDQRAEWPGFRGPERDGVVRGVRIKTDWSASPPVEMWRRPIGPGWSSFAVSGDLLYTQEQRGDDEIVACYRVTTGEPVWRHRDPVRFWESNGGAGPRATPTLEQRSRLRIWRDRNPERARRRATAPSSGRATSRPTPSRKVPDWGFASSPLVVDDVVIVAAAGTLAAYDVATGQAALGRPACGGSYSSPHRATIDGVARSCC